MLSRLKNYALIAAVVGAFYYLLSHHFIITSWRDFEVIEKTELTLSHTFYSIRQATPQETLAIDALRDAGIGEWMVDNGMLSQERLNEILRRLDAAQ